MGIAARANDPAGSLPYGDQRRLEIARALATEPKLLALDEPAAGMNASETRALKSLLETIRRDGVTILLIEHDVRLVMGVCDRVLVLVMILRPGGLWPSAVRKRELAARNGGAPQ